MGSYHDLMPSPSQPDYRMHAKVASLEQRLTAIERRTAEGGEASGFTYQMSVAEGNIDTAISQGQDITIDGTTRMEIGVTPLRRVIWVVNWRALVDHADSTAWRRPDWALMLSPEDVYGLTTMLGVIGPGHHAGAGSYASVGGTVQWELEPGVAYTCWVRLAYADGVAWTYHRSTPHTHLFGHTIPI